MKLLIHLSEWAQFILDSKNQTHQWLFRSKYTHCTLEKTKQNCRQLQVCKYLLQVFVISYITPMGIFMNLLKQEAKIHPNPFWLRAGNKVFWFQSKQREAKVLTPASLAKSQFDPLCLTSTLRANTAIWLDHRVHHPLWHRGISGAANETSKYWGDFFFPLSLSLSVRDCKRSV